MKDKVFYIMPKGKSHFVLTMGAIDIPYSILDGKSEIVKLKDSLCTWVLIDSTPTGGLSGTYSPGDLVVVQHGNRIEKKVTCIGGTMFECERYLKHRPNEKVLCDEYGFRLIG